MLDVINIYRGKNTLVPRVIQHQGAKEIIFLSVIFSSKKNNNLQFYIILNNEAILLESFIHIF
jgi:hypothetical protein